MLSWVPTAVIYRVEELSPRIDVLHTCSGCLIEVVESIGKNIDQSNSVLQRIVYLIYTDIVRSFANSVLLLQNGSLADSLTVTRPVIEYLLDIAYLTLFPDEISLYELKADEHNLSVAKNRPIPRDPTKNMRFINARRMKEKIRNHKHCPEIYREMILLYDLVSSVAEHTSPERKSLNLRRDGDWQNVILVLEDVARYAFNTLYTVDEGVRSIVSEDQEFERLRAHFQSRVS